MDDVKIKTANICQELNLKSSAVQINFQVQNVRFIAKLREGRSNGNSKLRVLQDTKLQLCQINQFHTSTATRNSPQQLPQLSGNTSTHVPARRQCLTINDGADFKTMHPAYGKFQTQRHKDASMHFCHGVSWRCAVMFTSWPLYLYVNILTSSINLLAQELFFF